MRLGNADRIATHSTCMSRRKRSELPGVTLADHQATPDRVRPTPNGGRAWTCHYCRHYASSETIRGRYVCRRHGGATPRQRNPLLRLAAFDRTGKWPNCPGRPIIHGSRSRSPTVRVADVVAEYHERRARAAAEFRWRFRRSLK